MTTINESEKAVKPAYESIACELLEIEPQGVLCGSNSGNAFGLSMSPYNNGGTL